MVTIDFWMTLEYVNLINFLKKKLCIFLILNLFLDFLFRSNNLTKFREFILDSLRKFIN